MKYSKETNKLIQDIGLDEKNTGSSCLLYTSDAADE